MPKISRAKETVIKSKCQTIKNNPKSKDISNSDINEPYKDSIYDENIESKVQKNEVEKSEVTKNEVEESSKSHIILSSKSCTKKCFNESEVNSFINDNNKQVSEKIRNKSIYKPFYKIDVLNNKTTSSKKIEANEIKILEEFIKKIKSEFDYDDDDINVLVRERRQIKESGVLKFITSFVIIVNNYKATIEYIREQVESLESTHLDYSIYNEGSLLNCVGCNYEKTKKDYDDIPILKPYNETTIKFGEYYISYVTDDFLNLNEVNYFRDKNGEKICKERLRRGRRYTEHYDRKAVLYLSKNLHLIEDLQPTTSIKKYKNLVDSFMSFFHKLKNNNCNNITYLPSNKQHDGRLYATMPSFQHMKSEIRHTIVPANKYIDWDITNCHFVILLNLCNFHKIPQKEFKYIKSYVENRENHLKQFMEHYQSFQRTDAKHKYICALYGSKSRYKDFPQFIKLKNEIDNITTYFINLDEYKQYSYSTDIYDEPDIDFDFEENEENDIPKDNEENEENDIPKDNKENEENEANDVPEINDFEKSKQITLKESEEDKKFKYRVLSKIISHFENICLNHALDFFEKNDIVPSCLQYDGCMVEISDKVTDKLLSQVDKYIKENTGFDVKSQFKELNKKINLPNDYIYTLEHFIVVTDQIDVAKKFIEDHKHMLNGSSNCKYIKIDNIWCPMKKNDHNIINLLKSINYCYQKEGYYVPFFRNIQALEDVANLIRYDDSYTSSDFHNKLFNSTLYTLSFEDGVYFFKRMEFKKYPVDDVYSTIKINRKFPDFTKLEQQKKEIFERILNPIFPIQEQRDLFLYILARIIAGHIEDKFWIIIEGLRNSGKGLLEILLELVFGPYVKPTEGNYFLTSNNTSNDVAKSNSWLMDHIYSRVMPTSEIKASSKTTIDGIKIKSIVSGGDTLTGRKNYQDETPFKLQSTPILNANKLSRVSPKDALDTVVHFTLRSQFVDKNIYDENKDKNKYMKLADNNIKNFCKNQDIQDAFMSIIIDYYKDEKPKLYGTVLDDTKNFIMGQTNECDTDKDNMLIQKYFKITSNEKDKVFSKDVIEHKAKYDELKYIGNSELKKKLVIFGANYKDKIKINKKTSNGYNCLQLIENPIDEEEDENIQEEENIQEGESDDDFPPPPPSKKK
jgi:hypothetical protein